jgi:hypothetical protein
MIKRSVTLLLLTGILVIQLSSCTSDNDPKPVTEEGLYINEIYASGEDWVELYNSLEISKNMSGYRIYDNPDAKYTLPAGTTIPAKGVSDSSL